MSRGLSPICTADRSRLSACASSVARPAPSVAIALLLGLALVGCGRAATGAALNTAVAVGVGAARVSRGRCFSECVRGTRCNPRSGLCESVPCEGACKSNEICDESRLVPRCVPVGVVPGIAEEAEVGGGL